MAYNGKLAPSVGNGLGGMPERRGTLIADSDSSPNRLKLFIDSREADTYQYAYDYITQFTSVISENLVAAATTETNLVISDGLWKNSKDFSSVPPVNSSLTSFFGASLSPANILYAAMVRIPDTNYFIATTIASGTWKTVILEALNLDTALPKDIIFTPKLDITQHIAYNHIRSGTTIFKKIADNTYLVKFAGALGIVFSYDGASFTVINASIPNGYYLPIPYLKDTYINIYKDYLRIITIQSDGTVTIGSAVFDNGNGTKLYSLSDNIVNLGAKRFFINSDLSLTSIPSVNVNGLCGVPITTDATSYSRLYCYDGLIVSDYIRLTGITAATIDSDGNISSCAKYGIGTGNQYLSAAYKASVIFSSTKGNALYGTPFFAKGY